MEWKQLFEYYNKFNNLLKIYVKNLNIDYNIKMQTDCFKRSIYHLILIHISINKIKKLPFIFL